MCILIHSCYNIMHCFRVLSVLTYAVISAAEFYVPPDQISTFIYKASGGMAHFMGGYEKACFLAEKYNATLIIDTTNYHGFPYNFTDIFGNTPSYLKTHLAENLSQLIWDKYSFQDIQYAVPIRKKRGWTLLGVPVDIKYHENYQNQRGSIRILCGRGGFKTPSGSLSLCTKPLLHSLMLTYAPHYQSITQTQYIAIHYRNTDKSDNFNERIAAIRRSWNASLYTFLYVATDSTTAVHRLRTALPTINITSVITPAIACDGENDSMCTQHLSTKHNLSTSIHAFANTWIELYILSHSFIFIGSKVSGMSRWIERIRHNNNNNNTIFTPCPQPQKYTTVVVTGISGWGSQLLHILAHCMTAHGRTLWVDDSAYFYHWNASTGMLKGYFTPQFATISSTTQSSLPVGYHHQKKTRYSSNADWLAANNTATLVIQADNKFFRHNFKHIHPNLDSLYTQMADLACIHFKFNTRAQNVLNAYQSLHNIPFVNNLHIGHSVAFHVRRGDKLKRESPSFQGSQYVQHYADVLFHMNIPKNTTKFCFVASDDFRALAEIQSALASLNFNCTLYSLVSKNQLGEIGPFHGGTSRTSKHTIVKFFTEISILTQTSIFIGTFNSNVGRSVALLRKCTRPHSPHYALSYGIDTPHWPGI
jgi:hypothetical protein